MTATEETRRTHADPIEELRDWLNDNWDPDLTVGEWWDRLGESGWAAPLLPVGRYGKGLSRGEALRVGQTIAEHGALGPPGGMAISLASPTIATHGTDEQVEEFIRPAVTGRVAWCQLFSEPGAGSDLAGLTTRAEQDGDVWVVNGQKVWTSGGHRADMGMLLARTNPTAPKHQGITWFACNMRQEGVEVRPLKEMTGNTMFSEVFLTNAVVPDSARIGDLNDGWKVANTTLMFERSGMGAGGGGAAGFAASGSQSRDLDKRVGDFVRSRPTRTATRMPERDDGPRSPARSSIDLAKKFGKLDDPVVRDGLAQSHILGEIRRLNTERHKVVRSQGGDIAGIANIGKLLSAIILRHNRDLDMRIIGMRGTLHAYDAEGREALVQETPGGAAAAGATGRCLQAQALPIYGGTDQIQKNIVGERVLGLPKEPGDSSRVPFNELPKNG